MQNFAKKILLIAAAIGLMPCCTACGKEPYYITFENLSGVAISEIHAVPDSQKTDAKNLLTEALPDGESITLEIGKYKEDYIDEGFYIVAYNAEDGTYQEFHMLMVKNGGLVTFYHDFIELCVAVDATHEEIEELIADMKVDDAESFPDDDADIPSETTTSAQ